MSLNDGPGVKHADADPLLFGRPEWPKEGLLQKVRAHAASVIPHTKDNPAILPGGLDPHFGRGAVLNGIPRVEHQIGYHLLDLFGIHADLWHRREALDQCIRMSGFQAAESRDDNLVQIR